ncbi:MAG: zf-HC2 domain-containing protein [Bacteroidales bacterium]|nr:zf-HC2 domain-containing protein [Bacteroidales bacterium]
MNCKQLHKNIFKYLEKELDSDSRNEMQQHLTSCKHCQLLMSKIEGTYNLILQEKITEQDPFFYTRLEVKMERRHEEFIPAKRIYIPALKYAFATFLVIFALISGTLIGYGFKDLDNHANIENISYVDEYTSDYYINEMDNEVIEDFLLNQ